MFFFKHMIGEFDPDTISPKGFKNVFSFYLKKDGAAFLSPNAGKRFGDTVKMFMFSVFLSIVSMDFLCYNKQRQISSFA